MREEKIIVVKECSVCPFCKANEMTVGYSCQVDDLNRLIKEEDFNPITPHWCPVKSQDIIITNKS